MSETGHALMEAFPPLTSKGPPGPFFFDRPAVTRQFRLRRQGRHRPPPPDAVRWGERFRLARHRTNAPTVAGFRSTAARGPRQLAATAAHALGNPPRAPAPSSSTWAIGPTGPVRRPRCTESSKPTSIDLLCCLRLKLIRPSGLWL